MYSVRVIDYNPAIYITKLGGKMRSKWIVLLVLIGLLSGCALLKQGIQDYKTGKDTPITDDEKSPKDTAQNIVDLVKNVPVVGNYAGFLLPVIAGFLTWRRGKNIRLGRGADGNITGLLGEKVGIGTFNLENLVKIVTDSVHGAFEIGADGSALKRSWKIWLSIALASISGALFIPGVKEFLSDNTKSVAVISFLAGLFGGVEKKIQSLENK